MRAMLTAKQRNWSGPVATQQHVGAAPVDAGPLPHDHRRRVDFLRPCRRRAARWSQDVFRRLSDHACVGDPASSRRLKEYGVTTFQAEDEIAAIASAIGASYAGSWALPLVGPGHCVKGRGDGPGDHDRIAAGDHQFAARRAFDRACPPRPNSPISIRRSMAAMATRRCR